MTETPESYANRVLRYVLTAKKAVSIHDPELQPLNKSEKRVDQFDLAVDQHFQKGFNEFVKAREAKPAPKDSFDAAVQKRFAEL